MKWTGPTRHLCAKLGAVEGIERKEPSTSSPFIHGHVFQTIDEIRDAFRAFAAHDNTDWLIKKNVHLSPLNARAVWLDTSIRRSS